MSDGFFSSLGERAKALASGFAMYSALGSFLLYLLGYLSLRFHLTVLGVATDLSVLDERYLFAGANCLVFLASSLPIAVLAAAGLCAVVFLPYRLLPASARGVLRARLARFFDGPLVPTVLGILVALAFIQLVMRKCFTLSNLLVREQMPDEFPWLNALLADQHSLPLYFSGLVLGTALTGLLLAWRSPQWVARPSALAPLRALLGVLFAIQVLLLPVNYGVLVHNKALPRVTAVGETLLDGGERAWLAWEGKDTVTYFVKDSTERRALKAVRRDSVKTVEVTGYDTLRTLLPPSKAPTGKESFANVP